MKDEHLMKITVSAIEGSRFVASAKPAESLPAVASVTTNRVAPSRFAVSLPEESLVEDDRSNLSPAQVVESRLMSRLRGSSLPVSHLQMRGLVRARFEA